MRILAGVLALFLAGPVVADDVSDALAAAQTAYEAGDVKGTAAQVALAQAGLRAQQNTRLAVYLPEAPAGYTREIVTEFAEGFGMFGGGAGAQARYTTEGGTFTLDLIADNELVTSMAGMFATPETLAMMGKVVKAGDALILDQEQNLTSLVGGRVMVTATGMTSAEMLPVVQAMDFAGLAEFDK